MLRTFFPHSTVQTFSTTRQNGLDDLKRLPELMQTNFVTMEQTHGSTIQIVTKKFPHTVLDTDAIITTYSGITLAVKHADCLPILLYHPKGIIAAVHAGRRGTQQQILKKMLQVVKNRLGISSGVQLWFGPAICSSCHTTNLEKTTFFNLLKENRLQAEAVFSKDTCMISYENRCTFHENADFYSYRKEGKGVPMNWSAIALLS